MGIERQRVVGFGAGGHARVMIEILAARPDVELVGLLDHDAARWGTRVSNVPVLGDDGMLKQLREDGVSGFFVGVGSTADTSVRRRLFEMGRDAGLKAVAAVHASAVISPSASIGEGAALLARAVVGPGALLGKNVIVNTGAIVEHDCKVGHHVHVASGAIALGGVRIGDGAHVGAGAVIRQGLCVGAGAIVGAGAVVVRDVAEGEVVVGVPAHTLHRREARSGNG